MKKLLYLCSQPHSGSTLLSLFLGSHSRLIGLGGIERSVALLADAIASGKPLDCTCGKPSGECPFWGDVARRLPPGKKLPRPQRYEVALESFTAVFGGEAWPVDSSKHVEPLGDLAARGDLTLRALHLIKDVRALTTSFIDLARRKRGITRPGVLLGFEYFWKWRRENGKIEDFLAERDIGSHRFGYEELCLDPELVMRRLCEWLELPYEAPSLSLDVSNSHLIAGNRMRTQEEKQTLRYDNRWFSRREWLPAAVLLPGILRYNSTAVYSNQQSSVWKR